MAHGGGLEMGDCDRNAAGLVGRSRCLFMSRPVPIPSHAGPAASPARSCSCWPSRTIRGRMVGRIGAPDGGMTYSGPDLFVPGDFEACLFRRFGLQVV